MREDLCQAGGPNGAFACSIPPKTAKILYLLHKLLKIRELRDKGGLTNKDSIERSASRISSMLEAVTARSLNAIRG